ncbi:hypothetical protein STEG23_026056 [Scotinomys teguina]
MKAVPHQTRDRLLSSFPLLAALLAAVNTNFWESQQLRQIGESSAISCDCSPGDSILDKALDASLGLGPFGCTSLSPYSYRDSVFG